MHIRISILICVALSEDVLWLIWFCYVSQCEDYAHADTCYVIVWASVSKWWHAVQQWDFSQWKSVFSRVCGNIFFRPIFVRRIQWQHLFCHWNHLNKQKVTFCSFSNSFFRVYFTSAQTSLRFPLSMGPIHQISLIRRHPLIFAHISHILFLSHVLLNSSVVSFPGAVCYVLWYITILIWYVWWQFHQWLLDFWFVLGLSHNIM